MLFSQKILNWFHIYGRKNLPWQKKNIYLIWISEVMLQRTQVKTVIPYFKKFKKKFPNLQVLAFAHIDEILYLWSGLGYYQRAYNIHKTAIIIQNAYNGIFPNNFNEILKLPGIGKSTTGAILSFAYNFGYAILDCNIKRILIRYHNINTDHKKKNQLELMLWSLINNYLPIHQSRAFNQAMMDIGALICTHRNPQCNLCPLKNSCLYYQNPVNLKQKIYYKKNKIGILFSIIEYNNQYLLKQYNQISIWKGLFYFPITFFSISDTTWRISKKKINNLNIEINPFIHYISNTKLYIYSHLININKKILHTDINQKRIWYNFYKTKKFGIPAPVRKILKLIQK
ncbi:Adenine DNA glycosylase [Buchnera aphidicola (Cinara cuneomaculata)]|uniref:Adenine DNA glycosylase n=1 Tax=Buchnera aphidicola (Cinara cuneomaculata) TaxID=1660040 RepID=A0A451CYE8_9GAMM|nr:Adenine DNA glycosylase [Buchnera aphidicola (Cinara cuneomaculata)]